MLLPRALVAPLLALVAGAALVGCSSEPTATVDPQLQTDHDALTTALEVERDLLPLVSPDDVPEPPDGAAAAVAAHVAALATAVGSPSPSGSPATSSPTTEMPARDLAASAAAAARSHLASVPDVTGPVARLLASVAASDLALAVAAGGHGSRAEATGPLPTDGPSDLTAAWQAALTAEQQARFAYQVAAARLLAAGSDDADDAQAGLVVHQAREDRAAEALTRLGAQPAAPDAAYALPTPLADPAAVAALLVDVERASAAAAANLVAASDGTLRRLPVGWLVTSAQAEARWGDQLPALPGLDVTAG